MSLPETQKPNPFLNSGLFMNTADTWTPYKMSFEGFAGGGKTFTMCCVALGIWQAEGKTGNVLLQDTERSAKFIVPFFRQFGLIEGKNFFVTHSRSLQRWGQILAMAEENRGTILLTDTVTHIYEEMMVQFEADNKRKVKYPQDAMIIKPMWKEKFSTPFVKASNTHLLFTGRAAWEYTMTTDEETQKKSFEATGVKMRGDNELAYEPDVVVLMERAQKIENGQVYTARHATILKDRSRKIDSKDFYFVMDTKDGNPLTDADLQRQAWEVFEPVYTLLASGNKTTEPETQSDKALGPLFVKGGGEAYYQQKLRAERIVEEIGGIYNQWGMGGTGGLEKALRALINMIVFKQRSTASLVELHPDQLNTGVVILEYLARFAAKNMEPIEKMFKASQYENINKFLAEEKDRYVAEIGKGPQTDDGIPEFKPPEPKAKVTQTSQLTGGNGDEAPATDPEQIFKKIMEKIMEAKTGEAADKVIFSDYAPDIATMSIEDRQRINTVRKNRKAQLKRGGAEAVA